jgi:hypothetical protein
MAEPSVKTGLLQQAPPKLVKTSVYHTDVAGHQAKTKPYKVKDVVPNATAKPEIVIGVYGI